MGVSSSSSSSSPDSSNSISSQLVNALLPKPPEIWQDYENPVYVIPDSFQLENEDKHTLIQHHITQGRIFEINRETGNIKKNSLTQRKYPLRSLTPILTIDEKSVKFIPIFTSSSHQPQHIPLEEGIPPPHRRRMVVEDYLKFSLNFKYSASVDCILSISFSAQLENSSHTISFSKTQFTSSGIPLAAGKRKTFRSKDHDFYAKFEYFPSLYEWEHMYGSFNALKTKLFDVVVLVMPKTPTNPSTHRHPRSLDTLHHHLSPYSQQFRSHFPAKNLFRTADTLIRDSSDHLKPDSDLPLLPFKELHCLQIDLYSLQHTMRFIKQMRIVQEEVPSPRIPLQMQIPSPNNKEMVEVKFIKSSKSSRSHKASSIIPILPLEDLQVIKQDYDHENDRPSSLLTSTPLPLEIINHTLSPDLPDSSSPVSSENLLTKAKLPHSKETIVITSHPIQVNLLDHYIELSKGVYHMYSIYGGAHGLKLKDDINSNNDLLTVSSARPPTTTTKNEGGTMVTIAAESSAKNNENTRKKSFAEYLPLQIFDEKRRSDDQEEYHHHHNNRSRRGSAYQTMTTTDTSDAVHSSISPTTNRHLHFSDVQEEEHQLCLICFTNHTDVVLFPCRHFNFCLECSQTLIEKSPSCPVCRVNIQFTIHLAPAL